MNGSDANLYSEFLDEEYAHSYMEETLNAYIATQIKVLREQRGWTQADLAERAEMKQARISVLENVDYSSWSINTLRRLARAFDLRLKVSFETFSSGVTEIGLFGRRALERVGRVADLSRMKQRSALQQPKLSVRGQADAGNQNKLPDPGVTLFSPGLTAGAVSQMAPNPQMLRRTILQ